MELAAAARLADDLMREHAPAGWSFEWDRARTRAGQCRFRDRVISLSRHLTALHTTEEVRDTLLHEIAHAIVGPGHAHDDHWRRTALRIGCTGERLVPETAARVEGPWRGTCPAGHVVTRHRRPVRVLLCARCRGASAARVLSWTLHGQAVPLGARYERELRSLQREPTHPGSDPAASGVPSARDGASRDTAAIAPGTRVRITASGRYSGTTGTLLRRGRTRYHVRTAQGVLTVPFALVEPAA